MGSLLHMEDMLVTNDTPHAIHIEGYDPIPTEHTYEDVPRAAEEFRRQVGYIGCLDAAVYVVRYGDPVQLAPKEEGVVRIVSQLTWLSAYQSERGAEDLVVPYGFDPQRKVAQGVAIPLPLRRGDNPSLVESNAVYNAANSCPYPAKVYPLDSPRYIPPETTPQYTLAPGAGYEQMTVQYREESVLDNELSARTGLPVYRTYDPHVLYAGQFQEGTIRIVEPKVAVGGLVMHQNDMPVAAMIGDEVRVRGGPYHGGVLGGRSLIIPWLDYSI